MNIINMLYYDRINGSEGVDVNKTSKLKECNICHYCYSLNKVFKFEANAHNGCHDLLIMSINFSILLFQPLKALIIAALLAELTTVKLYNYCKILIWGTLKAILKL